MTTVLVVVLATGSGPAWWNLGLGSALLLGGLIAALWLAGPRA